MALPLLYKENREEKGGNWGREGARMHLWYQRVLSYFVEYWPSNILVYICLYILWLSYCDLSFYLNTVIIFWSVILQFLVQISGGFKTWARGSALSSSLLKRQWIMEKPSFIFFIFNEITLTYIFFFLYFKQGHSVVSFISYSQISLVSKFSSSQPQWRCRQ